MAPGQFFRPLSGFVCLLQRVALCFFLVTAHNNIKSFLNDLYERFYIMFFMSASCFSVVERITCFNCDSTTLTMDGQSYRVISVLQTLLSQTNFLLHKSSTKCVWISIANIHSVHQLLNSLNSCIALKCFLVPYRFPPIINQISSKDYYSEDTQNLLRGAKLISGK